MVFKRLVDGQLLSGKSCAELQALEEQVGVTPSNPLDFLDNFVETMEENAKDEGAEIEDFTLYAGTYTHLSNEPLYDNELYEVLSGFLVETDEVDGTEFLGRANQRKEEE